LLIKVAGVVEIISRAKQVASFLYLNCLLSGLENARCRSYCKAMNITPSRACAIIVAGGTGSRAKANGQQQQVPKQLQILGGKAVLRWSLDAFKADPRFVQIIVVCADSLRDAISAVASPIEIAFASGGATRSASVRAGLALVDPSQIDLIFIHDAARPGLDQNTITDLLDALALGADGAAPARPVADALWHVHNGQLTQSQNRDDLLRVQTPQAFVAAKLLAAYATLGTDIERADDVAVARETGLHVVAVQGSARLDKITWPQDFARMTQVLAPLLLPRVGTGFDAHRFEDGDKVTLCGVQIAHNAKLAGHSDADVGWHALADAIYGGLSAGDIGHHFPPSQARWKGAPSSVFLAHAGDMVRASGGVINHVDVTLICEAPRVGPHRDEMIAVTAQVLGLRLDQVSIKATTTEAMGFTGRREGIAAQACATILLPDTFRRATEVPR
jgi:2-C-methyl-D-erythritol 4-phosphate cytidylyltransferase / 2-C-methyl-D-erythritol 2,4-cyclodiphosphate synthase